MSFYKTGISAPSKDPFFLTNPSIELFKSIEKARGRVGQLYKMGYYHRGIKGSGPVVGFVFVRTPGYIKDQIKRLQRDTQSVGRGVVNQFERLDCVPSDRTGDCGKLNDFMTSTLGPFVNEVNRFAANHKHWFQNLSSSTDETTQKYRKDLVRIHTAAKKLGISFTGPAPAGPEPGLISTLGQSVKGLVIAAFLLGGGYIAFKTWQESMVGR